MTRLKCRHTNWHAFLVTCHSYECIHIRGGNVTSKKNIGLLRAFKLATCRTIWQEEGKVVCAQNAVSLYLSRQWETHASTKFPHSDTTPHYECEIFRRQCLLSVGLISRLIHVKTKSIIQQGRTQTCKLPHTNALHNSTTSTDTYKTKNITRSAHFEENTALTRILHIVSRN